MAKRGGKAATRRQRQRAANRTAARPVAPQQPQPSQPSAAPQPEPVDVTSAAAPASSATAATASVSTPRRRSSSIATDLYGSSRLSEKAAAEYHYVVADLRNIVILSAVLVGLLLVAFVVINVLGVGKVV